MDPRDSMETLSAEEPDTAIQTVGGRDNDKRAKLKLELEKTDQAGPYQKLGSNVLKQNSSQRSKCAIFQYHWSLMKGRSQDQIVVRNKMCHRQPTWYLNLNLSGTGNGSHITLRSQKRKKVQK